MMQEALHFNIRDVENPKPNIAIGKDIYNLMSVVAAVITAIATLISVLTMTRVAKSPADALRCSGIILYSRESKIGCRTRFPATWIR